MGSIGALVSPALEHKRKRSADEYSAKRSFVVVGGSSPMASYSYRRRNALRFELISLAGNVTSNSTTQQTAVASAAASAAAAATSSTQTQHQHLEQQPISLDQSVAVAAAAPTVSSADTVVARAASATPDVAAESAAVLPSLPPPMAVDEVPDPVPSLSTPSSTDSIMSLELAASSSTIAVPTSDVSSDDVTASTPQLVDTATTERRSTRNTSPRKHVNDKRRAAATVTSTRARRQSTVN